MRAIALLLLTACGGEGPLIETLELPQARVQLDYTVVLEASGAEPVWELVDGILPQGLSLSETGQLTGLPEESGLFEISLAASDKHGEDIMDYELEIPPVLLMTGFGPFQDTEENPSIESIRDLDQELVAGLDIRVLELPVLWNTAWEIMQEELDYLHPSYIIGTGQAGDDAMRYETLARNVQYGKDNDGVQRSGTEVVEGAPEDYAATLPVQEIMSAVDAAGYATVSSDNAGSYLCNDIFYHTMHYAASDPEVLAAGFVHVPPIPDSTFTLEDVQAAQLIAVEVVATGFQTKKISADLSSSPVYWRNP